MGRSAYCTLVLDDLSISRVHASLRRGADHCELVDLGSRNGTFVNGVRIGSSPVSVRPDDRIELGDVEIRLEVVMAQRREPAMTRSRAQMTSDDNEITTGVRHKPESGGPRG